jgi:hypothetical protein
MNQITGLVLVLVLGAGMIAFPLRPNKLTAIVFIPAIVLWLLCGIVGKGIGA